MDKESMDKRTPAVELVRAYEEWAQGDEEGPALRKAALVAAAKRWRDE